jgi:hypothetical protein
MRPRILPLAFAVLCLDAGACAPAGEARTPGGLGAEAAPELELLCFAEERSGAIERFPFFEKTETMTSWLDQRLESPSVRAFYFEELPQTGIEQQDDRLRQVAQDAGIERCPMADLIEFLGRMPREAFGFGDCVKACVARHQAEREPACRRGCGP